MTRFLIGGKMDNLVSSALTLGEKITLTLYAEVDEVLRVSCDVSRFRGRAIRQNLPYPQESIRQGPQIGPLTCRMQLCGTTLEVDVLHGETVVGSSHIQVELDQSRRPTSDLWHDEDEDL